MKTVKSILFVGVLFFGICLQVSAQVVLPELEIRAMNYKYLNAVDSKESSQPVAMLQRYAASYDPKEASFYEDDYGSHFISFYIPDGKILALYDKDGNLIRTAEKYKNVSVPPSVQKAVATKYPNWIITKDVYRVTYHEEKGTTMLYKLVLEMDNQRLRVKINSEGEFL